MTELVDKLVLINVLSTQIWRENHIFQIDLRKQVTFGCLVDGKAKKTGCCTTFAWVAARASSASRKNEGAADSEKGIASNYSLLALVT